MCATGSQQWEALMQHIQTVSERKMRAICASSLLSAYFAAPLLLWGGCDAEQKRGSTDTPEACDGVDSPLLSPGCLNALSERCSDATTFGDCAAKGAFDSIAVETGYEISCTWVHTVQLQSAGVCSLPEVGGACRPTTRNFTSCEDRRCSDLPGAWWLEPATGSLVTVPCDDTGAERGPPLVWDEELTKCGHGDEDCACAMAACDALASAEAE